MIAGKPAFGFTVNGVDRPLHHDRQVLRASDLTLEQGTQDAMLARARAYLHGWGVVAGFIPTVNGTSLSIGPGYGVTPLGDELFLPQAVELADIGDRAIACCGPTPLGCSIVDAAALAAARAAAAAVSISSWLVARPTGHDAAPRPAVPQDCAHPASVQLPSRRCGGLEFALLCELPSSHEMRQPNCDAVTPFVCGTDSGGVLPLPWETPIDEGANFVVICELTVMAGSLTVSTASRRALWPVALMQEFIAGCVCPALHPEAPPDDPPRDEELDLATLTWARNGVPLTRGEILALRRSLGTPLQRGNSPVSLSLRRLAAIGVQTEGEFLTTSPQLLAKTAQVNRQYVARAKETINRRHELGLTPFV